MTIYIMRFFFVLMLALMVSCGCKVDNIVEERTISSEAVPPLFREIAYTVIQEKMPCPITLSGNVYWFNSPLDQQSILYCGRPAWGCADPWECEFAVWVATYNPKTSTYIANVWETALVNEVGYWVWDQCYNRNPEKYVDGKEVLDADFALWIQQVNAETRARAYSLVYSGQYQ
jgi:hypothetical protein